METYILETSPLWLRIFLGLIAGWCVFWWMSSVLIVASSLNPVGIAQARWHIFLILPPLSAITLPFFFLRAFYYRIKLFFWKHIVVKKIAERLEKCGIKVISAETREWDSDNYCEITAEIKPEQIKDYQSVYAWAVKKFKVDSKRICMMARPREYLDREWAKSNGIKQYAAENFSAPCVGCGKRVSVGIWWGDDVKHQKEHQIDKGYCDNCQHRQLDNLFE